MFISMETYITCDFPGGGGALDHLSPLWIRQRLNTFAVEINRFSYNAIQLPSANSSRPIPKHL